MRLSGAGAEAGSDRNMFFLTLLVLAVGTRLGAAARSLNQSTLISQGNLASDEERYEVSVV